MVSPGEWEEFRALARRNVQSDRQRLHSALRLSAIHDTALRAADAWLSGQRKADWDWRRVTKRPRVARLELAIWSGDRLCGLAFGPVERSTEAGHACLEYVEGRSGKHELSGHIIPIALATLEEFGRIVALPEVRLLGVMPGLKSVYGRVGYSEVVAGNGLIYLRKWIGQS